MDPALGVESAELNTLKRDADHEEEQQPTQHDQDLQQDQQQQQQQQRAKRTRYTIVACNECKRRKIKCNGETPCLRCGNLQLDCVYAPNCCNAHFKDSEEYIRMTAQLASLQAQVDTLFTSLHEIRSHLSAGTGHPPIDPSLEPQPYPVYPSYATVPAAKTSPPRAQANGDKSHEEQEFVAPIAPLDATASAQGT